MHVCGCKHYSGCKQFCQLQTCTLQRELQFCNCDSGRQLCSDKIDIAAKNPQPPKKPTTHTHKTTTTTTNNNNQPTNKRKQTKKTTHTKKKNRTNKQTKKTTITTCLQFLQEQILAATKRRHRPLLQLRKREIFYCRRKVDYVVAKVPISSVFFVCSFCFVFQVQKNIRFRKMLACSCRRALRSNNILQL